jgi:hypothetical protein
LIVGGFTHPVGAGYELKNPTVLSGRKNIISYRLNDDEMKVTVKKCVFYSKTICKRTHVVFFYFNLLF